MGESRKKRVPYWKPDDEVDGAERLCAALKSMIDVMFEWGVYPSDDFKKGIVSDYLERCSGSVLMCMDIDKRGGYFSQQDVQSAVKMHLMRNPTDAIRVRKLAIKMSKTELDFEKKIAYSFRTILSHARLKFEAWLKIVAKHGRSSDQAKAHPTGLMAVYKLLEDGAIAEVTTPKATVGHKSDSGSTARKNPFPHLLDNVASTPRHTTPSASSDDDESSSIQPPGPAAPALLEIVDVAASPCFASPAAPHRDVDMIAISDESPPRSEKECEELGEKMTSPGAWREGTDTAVSIDVRDNTIVKIMDDGAMIPAKRLEKGKGGFIVAHWFVGDPVETEILNSRLNGGVVDPVRRDCINSRPLPSRRQRERRLRRRQRRLL
eukprot:9386514-Pyramimonas_sp.AAC.1